MYLYTLQLSNGFGNERIFLLMLFQEAERMDVDINVNVIMAKVVVNEMCYVISRLEGPSK